MQRERPVFGRYRDDIDGRVDFYAQDDRGERDVAKDRERTAGRCGFGPFLRRHRRRRRRLCLLSVGFVVLKAREEMMMMIFFF